MPHGPNPLPGLMAILMATSGHAASEVQIVPLWPEGHEETPGPKVTEITDDRGKADAPDRRIAEAN